MKRKKKDDDTNDTLSKEAKVETQTIEADTFTPKIYSGSDNCVFIDLKKKIKVTPEIIDPYKSQAVFLLNLTPEDLELQSKGNEIIETLEVGPYWIARHEKWQPSPHNNSDIHQAFGTGSISVPYHSEDKLFSTTILIFGRKKSSKDLWLILFKATDSHRLQHLSMWSSQESQNTHDEYTTFARIGGTSKHGVLREFGDWSCLRKFGGYEFLVLSYVYYTVVELPECLDLDAKLKVFITKKSLFDNTRLPVGYESCVLLHTNLIIKPKNEIKISANNTIFTGHHLLASRDCLAKINRKEYLKNMPYQMYHYTPKSRLY